MLGLFLIKLPMWACFSNWLAYFCKTTCHHCCCHCSALFYSGFDEFCVNEACVVFFMWCDIFKFIV